MSLTNGRNMNNVHSYKYHEADSVMWSKIKLFEVLKKLHVGIIRIDIQPFRSAHRSALIEYKSQFS